MCVCVHACVLLKEQVCVCGYAAIDCIKLPKRKDIANSGSEYQFGNSYMNYKSA